MLLAKKWIWCNWITWRKWYKLSKLNLESVWRWSYSLCNFKEFICKVSNYVGKGAGRGPLRRQDLEIPFSDANRPRHIDMGFSVRISRTQLHTPFQASLFYYQKSPCHSCCLTVGNLKTWITKYRYCMHVKVCGLQVGKGWRIRHS